jgi:hypothetical protein
MANIEPGHKIRTMSSHESLLKETTPGLVSADFQYLFFYTYIWLRASSTLRQSTCALQINNKQINVIQIKRYKKILNNYLVQKRLFKVTGAKNFTFFGQLYG